MKNLLLGTLMLATFCSSALAQAPADPNLNPKGKAILKYLQSLESRSDKRLVSGQFTDFGNPASMRIMEKIHEKTGHWPALVGVDYADHPVGGLTFAQPNKVAIEYWQQGGLVTVSAHLYNPANTNGGGLRDKGVDLDTLLDPASPTHARWMKELDQLAGGLEELKNAGVVVLWRPFHEMNGNWFWWGGKEPAKFVKVWTNMFDYFTRTKHLDNLIWVYSPNHGRKPASYYPGDAYVDLVGLDAYTDFVDVGHISGYPEMAAFKKPFGFTEFGPHAPSNPPGDYDYRRFLAGIQKDFPRTVFFMSWNANWSLARNENTKELLDAPWMVNREDLPRALVTEK